MLIKVKMKKMEVGIEKGIERAWRKEMVAVKTLTGKEIEIDIEPTDKNYLDQEDRTRAYVNPLQVERIKERVEEKEGIPPPQQRLIFSGKQMNDEKTAADYKVTGGSVLHLVLALRGGHIALKH